MYKTINQLHHTTTIKINRLKQNDKKRQKMEGHRNSVANYSGPRI